MIERLRDSHVLATKAVILAWLAMGLGVWGYGGAIATNPDHAAAALSVLGWGWRLMLVAWVVRAVTAAGIAVAERLPEPEPEQPAEQPAPRPPVRGDPVARDPFGEWIEQQWRRLTGRAPRRRPRR